jgi:hypothetical protein
MRIAAIEVAGVPYVAVRGISRAFDDLRDPAITPPLTPRPSCRRRRLRPTEAWVVRFLEKLLTRPVESVVADIQRSVAQRGLSAKERKPVDKCLKYFRRRLFMMRYPQFLAQGLPIATGVIEGACRHLIQDRLGITGARWDLPGAEAVLKLRALHSSGDWKPYWRFHQEQEAARNYAQAA